MAIFIDSLKKTEVKIGQVMYIAKSLPQSMFQRVKDSWGVLFGKYTAVYFAEDIKQNSPEWKRDIKIVNSEDALNKTFEGLASEVLGPEHVNSFKEIKIGRNEMCLCGSKMKFKYCCGKEK